jgi:hypothetical protein
MKQVVWILALLSGAGFVQPAAADTFSITLYDGIGTTVDGTGTFTYSAGAFSDFTVDWDGFQFDFASVANGTGNEGHGCLGDSPISVFTYLTTAECESGDSNPGNAWAALAGGTSGLFVFSNGIEGITVADTGPPHSTPTLDVAGDFSVSTVPEPNSVFLMLAELLAVALVALKRNPGGLRSSSRTNP